MESMSEVFSLIRGDRTCSGDEKRKCGTPSEIHVTPFLMRFVQNGQENFISHGIVLFPGSELLEDMLHMWKSPLFS
jgi:hypothetical protein